ncbi:MAG: ABC transporter permease [Anaerolineae bacterium]|nr:ABC transporter permease [Anaerolineae bacterium]MDW8102064.1 ABC transporter permease [Anaerolineae bacterium]
MLDFILETLRAAVPAGTPLLFGTLGEIYAERSGILNLGVEGMMLVGAVMGFSTALYTGNPWAGIAAAALMGGILSLIHAFVCINLRGNQVVSGLALTMFGTGLSGLIGRRFIGVPLPASAKLTEIQIPVLSDIPVLGPLLFRFDPLAYVAMLLVPIMWFILYKTSLGISIRSVGEDPATADAMGVNVFAIRYLCTFIGGVLAGVAGAYLSIVYTPSWIEGMTAGAGWIVIALTIFSLWSPVRAVLGAYLFGGVKVLQYRLQPLGISPNLLNTLPFILTILVLVFASGEVMRRRIGAPSALGLPYSREEK